MISEKKRAAGDTGKLQEQLEEYSNGAQCREQCYNVYPWKRYKFINVLVE